MLDVSSVHSLDACVAFALQFRRHLADGDLTAAEAMVDVNATDGPFAEAFPAPGLGGFSYAHPDRTPDGALYVWWNDGLKLDFDVPFAEAEYAGRALSVRFELRQVGDRLEVRLTGAVPN
ncbi:hypothetical protein R5W23_001871 [Gemmata sp. JC673]|uniref:DUF3471 domain-containing protein n=1 Tax=Gemmata algarum TaxID=2975278 RepID=A0ABU5EZN0_9BACT|nr:hypothetical protein [Gemmata algarum]MDY3560626.1 hypothetical protein [Gemmata algarum]